MLVLDSDLVSIVQQGPMGERAELLKWLDDSADQHMAVTVVTFEEHVRGWMGILAKAKTPRKQVIPYARLHSLLEDYQHLPVLDFTDAAADQFVDLRRQHRRHGASDLKIAAIAITVGARLLSRNIRDFHDIEGLDVMNPLAP